MLFSQNVELVLWGTEYIGCLIRRHLLGWFDQQDSSWMRSGKLLDPDFWPQRFLSQHCIIAEGQSIHRVSQWPLHWWEIRLAEETVVEYFIITLYDHREGNQIWSISLVLLDTRMDTDLWKGYPAPKTRRQTWWLMYFGTWISCVTTWAPKDCFIGV